MGNLGVVSIFRNEEANGSQVLLQSEDGDAEGHTCGEEVEASSEGILMPWIWWHGGISLVV